MKALLLISIMTLSLEAMAKRNELPFQEPVRLTKVVMNSPLKTNLLSSYRELKLEDKKEVERKVAYKAEH